MAYEIISQCPRGSETLYSIVLKADDGYEETQQYVGDLDTLDAASKHFNSERLAWVAKNTVAQPVENNATSTDNVEVE